MRSSRLALLLPLGLLLGACGGNPQGEKTSYLISYDKNYEGAGEPTSFVVTKDNSPLRPADPTRTGFAFDGWFTDKECETAFNDFDKPLTDDSTLYAKWVDLKDFDDTKTISLLNKKLAQFSGKPSKTTMKSVGFIQYYIVNPPFSMGFESKEIFNTYDDIVTSTLYGPNEEGKIEKLVANTQAYADDKNLYYLSENHEDGKIEKLKEIYSNSPANVERMLNPNFYNMAMIQADKLESILKKEYTAEIIPEYNEPDYDPIEYAIKLDELTNKNSFKFTLNFETVTKPKQDDPSASMQQLYQMECTIYFSKNLITKAVVENKTLIGTSGTALQYTESTDEYDFDFSSEVGEYTGTRWNQEDFEERKDPVA